MESYTAALDCLYLHRFWTSRAFFLPFPPLKYLILFSLEIKNGTSRCINHSRCSENLRTSWWSLRRGLCTKHMKSIRLGFVSRDLSRFPVLEARVFFWVVLSLSRVTMDDPNKPRCLGETLRPAALFWPWTIGNHLTIRGWMARPLVLWAKIRIIVGVCCESHWWRWHICRGVDDRLRRGCVCLFASKTPKSYQQISLKFSGNYGTSNRWLHFGDVWDPRGTLTLHFPRILALIITGGFDHYCLYTSGTGRVVLNWTTSIKGRRLRSLSPSTWESSELSEALYS